MIDYFAHDAYENAISTPNLVAHTNKEMYKAAYTVKSAVPANVLYYLSRIAGPKKLKKDAKEYLMYVNKCKEIAIQFGYFMNNEWIFDNATALTIQRKIQESDPTGAQISLVPFDVSKIKWEPMIQNHAYGIKRYILHEEAYIPSLGYRDARSKMFNPIIYRVTNPTGKGIYYK